MSSANPFAPFASVAIEGMQQQGAQAEGQRNRATFDEALAQIEGLRQNDVVNLPERPAPIVNPFSNPAVLLGMAVQGRAAEAAAQYANINAQNRQREDRYREQVLQAHNFRQLRMQRYATTLADLQTRAAQAEIQGENQFRDRMDMLRQETVAGERFGKELALKERQTKADELRAREFKETEDAKQARMQAETELLGLQLDKSKADAEIENQAFEKWYGVDINQKRYARVTTSGDQIAMNQYPTGETHPDTGLPLMAEIRPDDPKAMAWLQKETALARAVTGNMMSQGIKSQAMALIAPFNTMEKGWEEDVKKAGEMTKEQIAKFGPDPARQPQGPFTPEQTPEQELQEAQARRQFLQIDADISGDFDFSTRGGFTRAIEQFSDILSAEETAQLIEAESAESQRNPLARIFTRPDQDVSGVRPVAQLRLAQFQSNYEQDRGYPMTPEGKGLLYEIARDMAQEASTTLDAGFAERMLGPGKKKRQSQVMVDQVIDNLSKETGIRVDWFKNNRSLRGLIQGQINQALSQVS